MKNSSIYAFLFLSLVVAAACEKGSNYPGGVPSPYIAAYDVRNMYKGSEVTLTQENMFGAENITGVVISDHSSGNMPEGLLVIQDKRRLAQLRGISIPIGEAAATYVPGDSVVINVTGGMLKKIDGILQLTGIEPADVKKVASGIEIPLNRVPSNLILADPERYESTLAVIVKGGFNPLPQEGDKLGGDKMLNDGFGQITLHTETSSDLAELPAHSNANYYGIVFNTTEIDTAGRPVPQFRIRKAADVVKLNYETTLTPLIITGIMADVRGGDGGYEYVQMLATTDIDFSVTPYSMVVTNNANASTPTGYPANGWGTGGRRTYKFDMTSGAAAKGTFIYVGGHRKMINGSSSTSMSSSNWIRAFDYVNNGGDGFGTKTGGLFANSGNASGVAVFNTTEISLETAPVDVIFVGTGGSLYSGSRGYRIANTDWYDIQNPITLEEQPFYRQGSNTLNLGYNTADLGYFYLLGGEYNTTLKRWTKARVHEPIILTKQSALLEIEGEGATKLVE